MKKIVYLLVAATIHLLAPWLLAQILGNLVNGLFSADSEGVYTFFEWICYGVSAYLVIISFRQTKPDKWNIHFFLGDYVGVLDDGTEYVPLGFLNGSVHTYTKKEINFSETINVVKLKDNEHVVAPEVENLDSEKEFEYKMKIKLEGAFTISDPFAFFKATGFQVFVASDFDRIRDKFYSTVIADISSNIDTIAAEWGYAEFKKKTDWTLKDILRESEEITKEEQDSLGKTLKTYGLTFDKISTYSKYDEKTEEILKGKFEAKAQREIDTYKAETDKKVKKINAQAEVVVSRERAKAITYLTKKIAEIPEYKGLTAAEVKEMVEASMDIWDDEKLTKQIVDIKGLPELVKEVVPVLEKLLQSAVNKKTG